MNDNGINYKNAGVDIEAGNMLVERIKPLAASTTRLGTMGGIGGFGALFDLKPLGYNDPILVASTDGVGTKLRIAIDSHHHSTVGIDLVAMCVNDLLAQGAEPLFFLDYFATGKLDTSQAASVVQGIAAGCRQAGAALIGGETAEMPGMYNAEDYDLAGFAVGVVERSAILPHLDSISTGDSLIGLGSSGIHSNGFSLVRHVISNAGLSMQDKAPFNPDFTLAETLLTPTKIYISSVLPLVKKGLIKGLAHITGGGLTENIPRTLPDNKAASVDLSTWSLPPVFAWLHQAGQLKHEEMLRVFNNGIGMVLIVEQNKTEEIMTELSKSGETVHLIGSVIERDPTLAPQVLYTNNESLFDAKT